MGNLRLREEPLLAEVFGFIEERYGEPISPKDVARAVGLTPGYLTTVVRRKSGRTVLEWITERRMAAARHLLVGTDLPVKEVAAGSATVLRKDLQARPRRYPARLAPPHSRPVLDIGKRLP